MVILSKKKKKLRQKKRNFKKKYKSKKKNNYKKKRSIKKKHYHLIGKGKDKVNARKSLALEYSKKNRSAFRQKGRHDQKSLMQIMLEKVCGKRPSDKCRISFIEQTEGCIGIDWKNRKNAIKWHIYLNNFGKTIKDLNLSCKRIEGQVDSHKSQIDSNNYYLHFDFDNRKYCCKPYPPKDEQAQQWISELGFPGLSEMAPDLNQLESIHGYYEGFKKMEITDWHAANNLIKSDEWRHIKKLISNLEIFNNYYETLKYFSVNFKVDFESFADIFWKSYSINSESEIYYERYIATMELLPNFRLWKKDNIDRLLNW